MVRRIISIDEERCNGCGACAAACHEGAIGMVNGKARLLRDDYCDGLGDCLPTCPTGAITFVEREAAPYDQAAVQARRGDGCPGGGCPGSRSRSLTPPVLPGPGGDKQPSRLSQWPVQIQLAPLQAPYFDGADLLVAADCTANAYGSFHEDFIQGRVTLIGCPKLDAADYREKLGAILRANRVRSVTVVRMEVPCCGGLQRAVEEAVSRCGRRLPLKVVTIATDGRILDR